MDTGIAIGLGGILVGLILAWRSERKAEASDRKLDRMAEDLRAAVAALQRIEPQVPPATFEHVMRSTGAKRVFEAEVGRLLMERSLSDPLGGRATRTQPPPSAPPST